MQPGFSRSQLLGKSRGKSGRSLLQPPIAVSSLKACRETCLGHSADPHGGHSYKLRGLLARIPQLIRFCSADKRAGIEERFSKAKRLEPKLLPWPTKLLIYFHLLKSAARAPAAERDREDMQAGRAVAITHFCRETTDRAALGEEERDLRYLQGAFLNSPYFTCTVTGLR